MENQVLIIEFDHDTRVLLRKTFEQAGFEVVTCANGSDAISALENIKQVVFIVISDRARLNSVRDLLQVLQRRNLQNVAVAQILENENDPKLPGMSCFLTKPLSSELILTMISSFLKAPGDDSAGSTDVGY